METVFITCLTALRPPIEADWHAPSFDPNLIFETNALVRIEWFGGTTASRDSGPAIFVSIALPSPTSLRRT